MGLKLGLPDHWQTLTQIDEAKIELYLFQFKMGVVQFKMEKLLQV